MMRQKLSWDKEEIKTLFKFVEIKKVEGVPLIEIFARFATCVGRGQKSVRNFYYSTLKTLGLNKKLRAEIGIDIKMHAAKEVKGFTKQQIEELVKNVDGLIEKGYSVRGACLKLANGNATKMIRIQNKYRSEKKQKGEDDMGNIIKMPAKNIMSDEDINALFMGLLKLVKKQEQDKAKLNMQIQLENANQKLKDALKEIVLKRVEIEKLQAEICLLKQTQEKKLQQQIKNRVKDVEQKSATSILKDFVESKKTQKVNQSIAKS